jgi:hypothetical protein
MGRFNELLGILKIYITEPKYIWYDIQTYLERRHTRKINIMREKVYKYDCNLLGYEYADISGDIKIDNQYTTNKLKANAVLIVSREIEHIYDMYTKFNMHIQNIGVKENENTLDVTIELEYPSKLISSGGKKIDYLMNRLSYIFGKKTIINIIEYKPRNDKWMEN